MASVDVFSAVYQVGQLALREIQRRSEDRQLVNEWFGDHAPDFCDNVKGIKGILWPCKLKRIVAVPEILATDAAEHILYGLHGLPLEMPGPRTTATCCWIRLYSCMPKVMSGRPIIHRAEHQSENVGYLHAKPTADIPIWTALAVVYGDHGRVSLQKTESGAARILAGSNHMTIVRDRVNLNAKWSGHIEYRRKALDDKLKTRDGWKELLDYGHTALHTTLNEAIDWRKEWNNAMLDPLDPKSAGGWWSRYDPGPREALGLMSPEVFQRLCALAGVWASVTRDAATSLAAAAATNARIAVELELGKPEESRKPISDTDMLMGEVPYPEAQSLKLDDTDLMSAAFNMANQTHRLVFNDFEKDVQMRVHANMTRDDARTCMSSARTVVHDYLVVSRGCHFNIDRLQEIKRFIVGLNIFCYLMELLLTADSLPEEIGYKDAGVMVAFA